MPKTLATIGDEGTAFTNSIVSSPLCCPSRAGFLSGEYPHNSGVFDNEPGYSVADRQELDPPRVAAGGGLSHRARRPLSPQLRPPVARPGRAETPTAASPHRPGLDTWFGFVGSQTLYQDATFSDNGVPVPTGANLHDYSTRVINREAVEFVRDARRPTRGRSSSWSPTSRPHSSNVADAPATAARAACRSPSATGSASSPTCRCRSRRRSTSRRSATSPTGSARAPPSATRGARTSSSAGAARWRRCRASTAAWLSSSPSCAATGELDNTAIFFTSDNGYFFGEHRIFLNKVYPYEEALRVPLLARVPPDLLGGEARSGRDLSARQPGRPDRDDPRPRRRPSLHGGGRLPRARRPARCARCSPGASPTGRAVARSSSRSARTAPAARSPPSAASTPSTTRCGPSATRTSSSTASTARPASATGPSTSSTTSRSDPYELRNIAANPAKGQTPSPTQAGLAAAPRLAEAVRRASPGATRSPFCE